MTTAEDKQTLANKMTVIWIIWYALFLSLFIYILVGHLLAENLETNMPAQDFPMSLLTNILFAVGVSELVIAYVLRWFILKQSGQSQGWATLTSLITSTFFSITGQLHPTNRINNKAIISLYLFILTYTPKEFLSCPPLGLEQMYWLS